MAKGKGKGKEKGQTKPHDGAQPPTTIETEEEMQKRLEKTEERMLAPGTVLGLQDFTFNAAPLCVDLVELLEDEKLQGLEELKETLKTAAMQLDDTQWQLFSSLPFRRIHRKDNEVHTNPFNRVDPTWKQIATLPKSGKASIFLHIGTEAPSYHLMSLLTRLGWYGVQINPCPIAGFEDSVQSVELDPGSHKNNEEFKLLLKKRQGLVPKPDVFMLVYVNLTFPDDLVESDSEEEEEAMKEEDETQDAEDLAVSEASASFGSSSSDSEEHADAVGESSEASKRRHTPSRRYGKNPNKEPPPVLGGKRIVGYGKIGVTRSQNVRKRLRAIRTSLAVGLQRLANGGLFVVCWPGLVFHPVFLFVVNSLRTIFQNVNLITQEDTCESFDVYILCTNFKREAAQGGTVGGGGSAFKSFLMGAHRETGVDDVLNWTLRAVEAASEARVGAGEKSRVKSSQSWDDLWSMWARKLDRLVEELLAANGQENVKKHGDKARTKQSVEDQKDGRSDRRKTENKADRRSSTQSVATVDRRSSTQSVATVDRRSSAQSVATVDRRSSTQSAATVKEERKKGPTAEEKAAQEKEQKDRRASELAARKEALKEKAKQEQKPVAAAEKQRGSSDSTSLPPVSDTQRPDSKQSKTPEKSEEPKGEVEEERPANGENTSASPFAHAGREASPEKKVRMRRLDASRSLPSLSGTFGACPGVTISKGKLVSSTRPTGVTTEELCKQFPLVKYGWRSALDARLFM